MINLLSYLQTQQPSAVAGGTWVLESFPLGSNIQLEIDGTCTTLSNGMVISNDDPIVDLAPCASPMGQYVFTYHNLTLPLCTMPAYTLIINSTSGQYSVSLSSTTSTGCGYSVAILDTNTFSSDEFTPFATSTDTIALSLDDYTVSCNVGQSPVTTVTDPIHIAVVASSELDGPSGPGPIPNVEYLVEICFQHWTTNVGFPTSSPFCISVDPTDTLTVIPAPYSAADLYVGSPNFEAATLATIQAGFAAQGITWTSPRFKIKKRSASTVDVYFPVSWGPTTNYVSCYSSIPGYASSVTYQPIGSSTQLIMGEAINYGNFNAQHNPSNSGAVSLTYNLNTPCGINPLTVSVSAAQIIGAVSVPSTQEMTDPILNPILVAPGFFLTTTCPLATVTAVPNIPCPTIPIYQWVVDGITYPDTDDTIQITDPPATVDLTYTCDGCTTSATIDIT